MIRHGGAWDMSVKMGAIWGGVLAALTWLSYFLQRLGVKSSDLQFLGIIVLAVFALVGFSAYKRVHRLVPSMLTALVTGIVYGCFGRLVIFTVPLPSIGAGMVNVLSAMFTSGVIAMAIGSMGAMWGRFQEAARR